MKARITLYSLLLATCLTSVAKDKMKITFNDASTVAYDVESITDITFTESPDDPVTPPNPSNKVLVMRINDAFYDYDTQGRCTSMTSSDGDFSLSFDYAAMSLKMYGYTVGTFTLTPQGYFSTLSVDFMGEKANLTIEYNSDGYITRVQEGDSDVEHYYVNNMEFYWENNLLVKVLEHETEIEDGNTMEYNDFLTITYSQTENKTNQWTVAMLDDNGFGALLVTGMCGNAPARLPGSIKWSYSAEESVSYTLNPDGSIKTEKVGNENYNYYYISDLSASPAKKSMKNILRRLSNKIAER